MKQKLSPGKSEIAGVGEFLCKLLVLLSISIIMVTVMKVTSIITLMTMMAMMEKMTNMIKSHLGKTKVGPKSKGARQKAHLVWIRITSMKMKMTMTMTMTMT